MRATHAAFAAALLVSSGLGAQNGTRLTEDRVLATLTADHPAVAALRRELGEAEAELVRARTLANPELGVTHEAPGDAEQIDLTLSWQLPHPGRRRLGTAAAEAGVAAARARLTAAESALRLSLRESYATWATAAATAERLETHAIRLDALAGRERQRAEAGEAAGLDARRLGLAASAARTELARARAARAAAEASLRAWAPDLPAGATPELPPLPSPTAAAASAEPPRLVALRAELDAARLAEQLAGRTLEMPSVTGGWQRQESPGAQADGPILGVAWPLPLLDRRRAERLAARSRVEAATAELAMAEREVAAAREAAAASYQELHAAALAARETAELAPAALSAALAAFEAGEAPLTDLLETLDATHDAKLAAVELLAEALAAQRRLESLSPATPVATADPQTPTAGDPR
jgi:outer membrane protein TolC